MNPQTLDFIGVGFVFQVTVLSVAEALVKDPQLAVEVLGQLWI